MNQKQNDELAFQLRENLKKRKDQKKSLGKKNVWDLHILYRKSKL